MHHHRRARRTRTAVVAAVGLIAALTAAVAPPAAADPGTMSVDLLRTGWDPAQPHLTPADAAASDFGLVFSTPVTGQVYAQPVVASGTLVVGTESNDVYGLDPTTGTVRWTRNLGKAWPATTVTCSDLLPTIGITSTPVYDPASGYLYLTSKVDDGVDAAHPHWYVHALDPVTGAERSGWPRTVQGSPSNDPTNTFNPSTAHQRPGLLLLDGVVYAAFGAHCDRGPYRGYVVGVSTTTGAQTAMWTTEAGSGASGGGVWQGGGALMSDGPGRIFLSTGNGVAPPVGPGSTPPGTLSEAVVRLQVQANGSLKAADFFSPVNAPTLDTNDTDLGSGGPVGLPDSFGTPSTPHVLVEQGKDGRIFLLDRDSLGGRGQGAGGTDGVVGQIGPYQGLWGHPAVWGGGGGYVYTIGSYGPLRAFRAGTSGSGAPALVLAGQTAATYGYTSGSPIVTSSGTTSGSATVWMVSSSGPTGAGGTLRAFDAVPSAAGALTQIFTAAIGTASKFAVPLSYAGRIYVGTRDGAVKAFGRPASTALTGATTDLGQAAVGATVTRNVTLTAQAAVTVTSASAAAPFGATSPSSTSLSAGQTISIPVRFTPTAVGSATGSLTVVTGSGTFTFGLTGSGTAPGLSSTPSAVAFDAQPTGTPKSVTVQLTNTGTTTETLLGVTAPSAPFSVTGLPAVGTTWVPGASFVATVTYAPTAAGSSSTALAVRTTSSTVTVPVSGSAVVGQGHLTLTPSTVDFGAVAVGGTSTQTFTITNDGTIPVTITKAKAPASAFTSSNPLPEGLTIPAGGVINQTVTFSPAAAGGDADSYLIASDSGQGTIYEQLTGSGVNQLPAPTSGWTLNGSATVSGADLVLNPAAANSKGSAVFPTAIPSSTFSATFTTSIGGGTGADGLTLAFLDASVAKPTSVGGAGNALGLGGVPGVGVALKTTYTSAVASSNVAGIVTSTSPATALTWVAQKALPVNLRSGTHVVTVNRAGGHLVVAVDGTQALDSTQALPPSVYVAFTGSSGSKTDSHVVRNAVLQVVGGPSSPPTVAPLSASPTALDFVDVPVGTTSPASVVLTNTSSVAQQVTAVVAPATPFSATMPAVGTTVAAGATLTVPVRYAPTADASDSSTVSVTTTGGTVTIPLTGQGFVPTTGSTAIPAPTAGGWTLNGSAVVSGSDLVLNPATASTKGSAVWPTAIPSATFTATFTTSIGGGTGADGLALAFLDASVARPTSIGGAGGSLGLAGVPGVGVALKTTYTSAVASSNVAGVVTSATGSTALTWVLQKALPVNLRTGTHVVTVARAAGHLTVAVDGVPTLDSTQALPATVYLAFTGSSGGKTDAHAVRSVSISYG